MFFFEILVLYIMFDDFAKKSCPCNHFTFKIFLLFSIKFSILYTKREIGMLQRLGSARIFIDQNSPRFSPCVPECTMDQRGSKCVLKDKKSKFFKYSQIFTQTLLHIWAFEMSNIFCTVVTQGQQQSFKVR